MRRTRFAAILTLFAMLASLLSGVSASAQSSGVDLRIWTVTATGDPVYDICYTLADYSNLGCDVNQDGAVLFEDIPPGRYYVEPTINPGGTYWTEPFTILVDEYHTDHVVEAYEYRGGSTSGTSSTDGAIDVHLITRDPNTGDVLTDACYEFVGYSNIGCDVNQDGHITFADIPFGEYTIRETTTPAGYTRMGDYQVTISNGPDDYSGPLQILLSQGSVQAPEDRVNLSVVFYDPYYGAPVALEENCVQLLYKNDPISNIGCDEDVRDGQVDFMHVAFLGGGPDFTLDVSVGCPYGLIPGANYQVYWFGDKSVGVFVEVSPEAAVGCT